MSKNQSNKGADTRMDQLKVKFREETGFDISQKGKKYQH